MNLNLNNAYEMVQYELDKIEINKPFQSWLENFLKDEPRIERITVEKSGLSPQWYDVEIKALCVSYGTIKKITDNLVEDWIAFTASDTGKDGRSHSTYGIHFPVHIIRVNKLLGIQNDL